MQRVAVASFVSLIPVLAHVAASSDQLQSLPPGLTSFKCGDATVEILIDREMDESSPTIGRMFVFLRLPQPPLVTTVELVRQDGPQDKIYEQLARPDDCIMTNGGFWGYNRQGIALPIGWLSSNGKSVSPRMSWSGGGALCVTGETVSFYPARLLKPLPTCAQALQSKPFIIEGGKVAVWDGSGDRFNRTAVGIDSKGRTVIAGGFSPDGQAATLQELASFVVRVSAGKGSAVATLLALDGGPGAHIVVPAAGIRLGSNTINYVPSVVRFTSRKD